VREVARHEDEAAEPEAGQGSQVMVAGSRRDQVMAASGAKPGSAEDYPFGDEVAVFQVAGRMFALVSWSGHPAVSALGAIRPGSRLTWLLCGYHPGLHVVRDEAWSRQRHRPLPLAARFPPLLGCYYGVSCES
jgi:hypothetical protein